MEYTWNRYYGIPKGLMTFSGQWPYQEKRVKFFRASLLNVIIWSMMVPQITKLIQCDGDMRCIMLIISPLMLTILMVSKLFASQLIISKIKTLIDYQCNDWETLKDAEEYEIMKRYAVNVRLYSAIYTLNCYFAIVLFISLGLTPQILNIVLPLNESRPRNMPYEAHYFVDEEKYYFYILLHLTISLFTGLTPSLAYDCCYQVFIAHVCSLFAVAGFRFKNLLRNDCNDATNGQLDNWKIYNRKIAFSVHAHWRALRFVKLLESTFCISSVVIMILIIGMMSITLLRMALQINEIVEMIRYSTYSITQLMHLFVFCLQGQILIDHSVQIRNKIYDSSWYKIPVKSQRLLLYVMQRNLEPNFMSAGKIFVFSLNSFTTVMQTSISYFTVLASFQP